MLYRSLMLDVRWGCLKNPSALPVSLNFEELNYRTEYPMVVDGILASAPRPFLRSFLIIFCLSLSVASTSLVPIALESHGLKVGQASPLRRTRMIGKADMEVDELVSIDECARTAGCLRRFKLGTSQRSPLRSEWEDWNLKFLVNFKPAEVTETVI